MKYILPEGETSFRALLFIPDSTSTTGAGKTGLAFNSAGLSCYSVRPGSAASVVNLATQTPGGAYSSGGFCEIDATNMPGWYRFDIPNALLTTGVKCLGIQLKGATGMAPVNIEIEFTQATQIAQTVWDRVLTGSTHNIATSAGRRLREIAGRVILTGTVSSATARTLVITGGSATTDIYEGNFITIVTGTGAGQTRIIRHYDGSSGTIYIGREWVITPDGTSEYQITADFRLELHGGIAQGGTSSTITLESSASSVSNLYDHLEIALVGGTGAGQARQILSYNGSTKVATMHENWVVAPDNTTIYLITEGRHVTVTDNLDKTGYSLAVTPPSAADIRAEIDSNSTKLDATVSSRLAASSYVAPLDASTTKAQVVAALSTDAQAELSSLPGTTPTLMDMIKFVYQYFRNRRTATANTEKLYKNDNTTELGSATISDDQTTFDKGRMG